MIDAVGSDVVRIVCAGSCCGKEMKIPRTVYESVEAEARDADVRGGYLHGGQRDDFYRGEGINGKWYCGWICADDF